MQPGLKLSLACDEEKVAFSNLLPVCAAAGTCLMLAFHRDTFCLRLLQDFSNSSNDHRLGIRKVGEKSVLGKKGHP